ncbi:polysaccharide biosynthesis protein [Campylobacter gracilis]|uniref:Polysaccharide biosynthesis protein n=3 Tax=Campylobacter TaxID=194 RepID=C8PLJ8_9BACT|nr:nucleoside-diphosphate sugar epimerase/dehydratase [Campylobacter gracilis]AKT92920.1 UDP-N-acetylglucosamine C-6 dehydratase [Campylobacter gracilis]EEV16310.1 polysaccharide biosynthesis protein [Campylobacter gracilis RM3268]UEB44911.1 polysaccharide biosynthesis protein [Campylobacter gracilis]SUW78754.1 general glycosylation pathway protein [Campylobacter gracilis]
MLLKPTKFSRFAFFLLGDIFISILSVYIAFLLRFSGDIPNEFYKGALLSASSLTAIKIFYFWFLRIYLVPWRFFGLYEARKLFYAHVMAALTFLILFFLASKIFNPFPRSVIIIDAAISFILIGGIRISKRMFLSEKKNITNNEPCIVVGATSKTFHVLKGMRQKYINYYPVGVVDGRPELVGTYCENYVVRAKSEIPQMIKDSGAKTAIIALALYPDELKQLYDELFAYGLKDIKLFSLLEDESKKIRDVSIEDLLARKPKDLDTKAIENFIKDKIVLVTGAGGTIGSEICKQCLKFGAKRLIMVEHSELNLYSINEATGADARNELKMINVVYRHELEEVFAEFHPEVVVHAAAYKHVPLCEFNPHLAVKNNVIGTKNVIDLSKKYGAKKVVLISTDKAVRPTNIMGTTKRICELYALNSNDAASDTQIVAVRFGNVLGSSGSVIPKFKRQIEANEPLTVTHPEITRYFMLVSEACQLVLQAASIAQGGELFVLDMGEPVKIADLAKRMLQLAGKEELGIKFVGLRPGEKLYEELLIDENDKSTKYQSIFVTHSAKYDLQELSSQIEELSECEDAQVADKLKRIVPEFSHRLNDMKGTA